jgi:hypothetical protein
MGGDPPLSDKAAWMRCGTLSNGKLQIRKSTLVDVTDKDTPGRGLFANTNFKAGDIITVYGGRPIYQDEANKRKSTVAHRFMLRISDSTCIVDGSQFADGITRSASPGGRFHPIRTDGPQHYQGTGSMANHATGCAANAKIAFVALTRTNACKIFPRIPTLRAKRHIAKGEEILFDYGTLHRGM